MMAFTKRVFDLFLSLCLALILLVPILIIAILVKLTSEGPALYWSDRVGVDNKIFKMPKFRTMRKDAPEVATHLLKDPDANRTPIGPFLRISSLDELPQLWSVLKGDMSFVGPRPEVPKYKKYYTGVNSLVLSVTPGITDLASIKYRHEEGLLAQSSDPEKLYTDVILQDKLRINREYINNGIGLLSDFGIIITTLLKIKCSKKECV